MKIVLWLLFVSGFCISAHASDARDLVAACKIADAVRPGDGLKADQVGQASWCQGMVEGVMRTLMTLQEERDDSGVKKSKDSVCIPYGVSLGEHVAVILKYAMKHPDEVKGDAPTFVIQAILDAFPCKA